MYIYKVNHFLLTSEFIIFFIYLYKHFNAVLLNLNSSSLKVIQTKPDTNYLCMQCFEYNRVTRKSYLLEKKS